MSEWEPTDRLVLALPEPYEVPPGELAPVAVQWAVAQRQAIRDRESIPEAIKLAKRLAAFQRYVNDRKGRDDLAAEERRTEVLIGHLLGRVTPGQRTDLQPSSPLKGAEVRATERSWFRLMADHEDWVEEWLTRANRVVSRQALLDLIASRLARRSRRGAGKSGAVETDGECYRVLEGDCFAYDDVLAGEPVDFIVTDAPYKATADAVALCERLAQHACRWLRPEGSVLLMIGQMYLPDVVRLMAPHLHYRWTLAYLTPGGQAVQIWPHKINSFWKPVIWFTNFSGRYRDGWRGDASNGEVEWLAEFGTDLASSAVNDNDKRDHVWGQSESGMYDLMRRFVSPGASVLDPFMGAGTTGVIAVRLGCRFVGIDLDPENVRIAAERLAQEQADVGAAGQGGADGLAGSGAELAPSQMGLGLPDA